MSGITVVMHLLGGSAAVASVVQERIYPVVLPDGAATPAVVVRGISHSVRNTVGLGERVRRVTERMQATLLVGEDNYPSMLQLKVAVELACAARRVPQLGVLSAIVVLQEPSGPEMHDQSMRLFVRPLDFMVTYNEPTPAAVT